MPKVTLESGLKVHYQQEGEGPDLVMIHGLTGNLAVWHLKILPMLWDRFRIVTFDLRGHGYTDVPPTGYTLDQLSMDLAGLLDALEIPRCSIVGHSYGADLSLYFAYHYPERTDRVVAIEAALPAMIDARSHGEWSGWKYWTDVLERSGIDVPPDRRCDPEYLLRLSLQVPKKWGPLNGLPRNPRPFLRLLDETSLTADYLEVGSLTLDNVARIQTPVTLLYTEASAFVDTYDYLRGHLPNVEPVILPRTEWGHFGPLEQPEAVAEQILASLTGTFPSAQPAASGR